MRHLLVFVLIALIASCKQKTSSIENNDGPHSDTVQYYGEKWRPRLHFSPEAHWMNDPNGMVYYKGEYHLFYQYYPDGTKWGPMHWGHATTTDLVHWKHLPIALYPDSLGYIFSGSAVVDEKNTSGFGTDGQVPLVAIFTYHQSDKEKAGDSDFQYQGIAYSVDDGKTWTKYERNPVLKNQGIRDFRDPKVFWYEKENKWVMILAVKDHVELWSSKDLREWSKLSDFGKEYGSHGGVWECPDLFPLPVEGTSEAKWVMLLSINPGGPNGGSATQYFTGNFDGKRFIPDVAKNDTLWIDYGPDDYAGVTWSNAPDGRRIFLGWMSNWDYAQDVPTGNWRSACTAPRDLKLKNINGKHRLSSVLSPAFLDQSKQGHSIPSVKVKDSLILNNDSFPDLSKSIIRGVVEAKDFALEFYNSHGQRLMTGFDAEKNEFYIDRSKAGDNSFSQKFLGLSHAPRFSTADKINFTILLDEASIEVFFDDGISVMTAVFFPAEPLTSAMLKCSQSTRVEQLNVRKLNSIWD